MIGADDNDVNDAWLINLFGFLYVLWSEDVILIGTDDNDVDNW
jgi:hypothetical protein